MSLSVIYYVVIREFQKRMICTQVESEPERQFGDVVIMNAITELMHERLCMQANPLLTSYMFEPSEECRL